MSSQNKGWWKTRFNEKEELISYIQQCLNEDKSIPKIAIDLGTSGATIHSIIKKNKLTERRKYLRNEDWLREKYIKEKLSMNEISKILNVSYQAIDFYFKKYGIEKRDIKEVQKIASKKYRKNSEKYLPTENTLTKGYSIWCDNLWFGSAAEFLYYLILKKNGISFKFQNYIEGKRPDYLINKKMIVEVKAGELSLEELDKYNSYAKIVKEKHNYSYKIINVAEKYKTFYYRIRKQLKIFGAKRGIAVSVNYDDFSEILSQPL